MRKKLIAVLMALGMLATSVSVGAWVYLTAFVEPVFNQALIGDGTGHASAVHIGDGLFLTANHVIEAVEEEGLINGKPYKVLWISEANDVALISAPELASMPAAELACTMPEVGTEISIRGNPLFMRDITTWGRVAGYYAERDRLILDASAGPGNSGGPVYNEDGEVVGLLVEVAVMRLGYSGSLTGHSMAVPGPTLCKLLAR